MDTQIKSLLSVDVVRIKLSWVKSRKSSMCSSVGLVGRGVGVTDIQLLLCNLFFRKKERDDSLEWIVSSRQIHSFNRSLETRNHT